MKTPSERLAEYLPLCPENFRLILTGKMKSEKLSLSRATEAARRMASKDIIGAWKFLKSL